MKRIDSRTVEFTTLAEMGAHEAFNTALDRGLDIIAAAREALEAGLAEGIFVKAKFSRDFVEYLSEGTLWVTNARTVITTAKGKDILARTEIGA